MCDTVMSRDEISKWLRCNDRNALKKLYRRADEVRERSVGEEIHVRGIINISNYCTEDCLYCGLRAGNAELKRYRLTPKEIVATTMSAASAGYRTMVLQSGEDPHFTEEMVAGIVRKIKSKCDIAITLSLGERREETYRAWFEAGADRYLLKHETSDAELYARLHPGERCEERIEALRTLKRIGFQTGSGIMVGLPGQTYESVASDILLFRELDLDMIGCGPFVANPKTPLTEATPDATRFIQPDDVSVYKVVALTRIVNPLAMLPATTALFTINPREGRRTALAAGGNVVMFDVTPASVKSFYEIYPKTPLEDGIGNFTKLCRSLEALAGRKVSFSKGHSPKSPALS
ncbi:MAG: [FeFe] hydrogenase H-cluster radical SAM maturase HydE [bacterium]